jgi:hypothetical protein
LFAGLTTIPKNHLKALFEGPRMFAMSRFFLNLRFFFYFLLNYRKVIPMGLTPAELQTLQADLDTLKAAVAADTTAQANIATDQANLEAIQAQLAGDTAAQIQTAAAVNAAETQLLADAQADFTPAAS